MLVVMLSPWLVLSLILLSPLLYFFVLGAANKYLNRRLVLLYVKIEKPVAQHLSIHVHSMDMKCPLGED